MSGAPTMTPPEILNAVRQQVKNELEVESMKSSILYQKQYQKFLKGAESDEPVKAGETEQININPDPIKDLTTKVRAAYGEAYALRAFREIMDDVGGNKKTEAQAQPQIAGSNIATSLISAGVSPQDANKWLSGLSPQALGALIALQTGNPQLAQMSFAMGQNQQQQGLTLKDVIELNKMTTPNMNVDFVKLLEVVKTQPQGISPKELVGLIMTGIELAKSSQPQAAPAREEKTGLLETLMKTPEGVKAAKEMGLIGNDASTLTLIAEMRRNDQLFQKQMKDSDRNWELRLEELRGRKEIAAAKIAGENKRTEMLSSALQRIGGGIAEALMGGETAEDSSNTNQAALPAPEPQTFECPKCKNPVTLPAGTPAGQLIECSSCHAKLQTTAG